MDTFNVSVVSGSTHANTVGRSCTLFTFTGTTTESDVVPSFAVTIMFAFPNQFASGVIVISLLARVTFRALVSLLAVAVTGSLSGSEVTIEIVAVASSFISTDATVETTGF